uniref:G-protein coupled receptors family 1 profile domain-containing protein n=1 Tax=Globodera rostochiensis TaxID=31243 RepID=A0A914GQ05_GLORO
MSSTVFIFFVVLLALLSVPLPSSSASLSSLAVFSREDVALLYQRLKSATSDAVKRPTKNGAGHRRATTVRTSTMPGRTRHRSRSRQQHSGKMTTTPVHVSAPKSSTPMSPSPSTWSRTSHSSTTILITPVPPRTVPPTSDDIKRIKDQRIAFVASPASESSAAASPTQILWVVLIVLIGVFFTAATSIGNALVMLSICVDKKLQTISNYFLFSLAVADLTVGIISIPLMTLYTVTQSWNFGYTLCQFWLCIDYLMCNASALNLLLISFDRYFSVTRPLSYRPKRTTRKALAMIAASYLLSLLLWPPWIVLWPYLEGRFIVEESAVCVVQFLAQGNSGNWLSQLVTVGTAAAAFYIPVTIMIVLYYKVYLETQRRQKELRKLQDGQIRGLQSPSQLPTTDLSLSPYCKTLLNQPPISTPSPSPITAKPFNQSKSGLNFLELVNNLSPTQPSFRKKERFSLLSFCIGKAAQTDISSEDSMADECGAVEDTSCGGGAMTTSNLDSILADSTPIELAISARNGTAQTERNAFVGEEEGDDDGKGAKLARDTLELDRTSRPSSVHTYNSIVIIEYPDGHGDLQHQRPSVRLSSHEEVASISARNSVERRIPPEASEGIRRPNSEERKRRADEGREREEDGQHRRATLRRDEKGRLTKTKSCPAEGETPKGTGQQPEKPQQQQSQQQNGTTTGASLKHLMRKSDIILLREEQMRRSEKERRRNERKQEGKAAKTLSAILFAFIITWTPYNVIVCLEAFYPNSVPNYLFTLSYFLSYVNSTINPLCYALCNARFRMTYLRIIKCKWRRPSINRQPFADNAFGRTSSGRKVLLKRHSRARGVASSVQ